jgi:hypothetical protein
LIEGAADVVAVALDCFYLSSRGSQPEHGEEVPAAGRAFQLRYRRRTEMGLGENANDSIDLGVAPGHPRNEPRQDHEPVAQPETSSAAKIAEGGLYDDRLRAEGMPQGLEGHAWIAGVPAVVLSKERQRAGANLLHGSRGDPDIVQQPSVWLPSRGLGGCTRG